MAALPDLRRHAAMKDAEQLVIDRAGEGDVEEVIDWPQEERDRFREIAAEVWKDYSELSELAGEAYQVQMDYLTRAGIISAEEAE
jgi:hypothetical protein